MRFRPVVDDAQSSFERLAVTTRSARMDDPALFAKLHEERVVWDERLREGQRVPAPVNVNLNRRLAHFGLLSFACSQRRMRSAVAVWREPPIWRRSGPHLQTTPRQVGGGLRARPTSSPDWWPCRGHMGPRAHSGYLAKRRLWA